MPIEIDCRFRQARPVESTSAEMPEPPRPASDLRERKLSTLHHAQLRSPREGLQRHLLPTSIYGGHCHLHRSTEQNQVRDHLKMYYCVFRSHNALVNLDPLGNSRWSHRQIYSAAICQVYHRQTKKYTVGEITVFCRFRKKKRPNASHYM